MVGHGAERLAEGQRGLRIITGLSWKPCVPLTRCRLSPSAILGRFPGNKPNARRGANPHFDESENKTPDASHSRQQPITIVLKSGSIILENLWW